MNAFAWLSDFIFAIAKLFPRRIIVPTTHQLLVFKRGKHVLVKLPGVRWYWPFWTRVSLWPVVLQRVITEQRIETRDAVPVWVKAVVLYRVKDLAIFLTRHFEPDDMIGEISEAGVKAAVNAKDLRRIQLNGIDSDVLKHVRSSCRSMGIQVIKARLTEFCPTTVYSLTGLSGMAMHPTEESEE